MSSTLNATTAPEVTVKLTQAQQERYRELRNTDMPSFLAYRFAQRFDREGLPFGGLAKLNGHSFQMSMSRGPFTVVVTLNGDLWHLSPARAELGRIYYSTEMLPAGAPDAIRINRHGDHFMPSFGYWKHRASLSTMGMSKGVASELAARWTNEDMREYQKSQRYSVTVSVRAADVELARDVAHDVPLGDDMRKSLLTFVSDSDMVPDTLADARRKLTQLQALTDFSSTEGDALPGGE